MNSRRHASTQLAIVVLTALAPFSTGLCADPDMHPSPIIIAHRGASGYLPEHTLEAKAMAHAQGADYLEQDLVLTKDDVPIVLHDIHLDTVTDVAQRYPERARPDGRYYAVDFTLAEIQTLAASERFHHKTGQAVFPGRFPPHVGRFHIPTFEEELRFIQGLNGSTGRVAGIYPEIKQPKFHRAEGKDITRIVLEVLSRNGYGSAEDPCYLQCFDAEELKRVRNEFGSKLKLVQLLDKEPWMTADSALAEMEPRLQEIADYADGIGPALAGVFPDSGLVGAAHRAGLVVHPWTYRADSLTAGFASFEDLHRASVQAGVDGVFSDFPDQSRMLFQKMSIVSPE